MSGEPSETPPTSEVLKDRRRKLERIRESGVEPFPHEFSGREEIAEVRAAHQGLAPGVETESRHRIAGRLVARRGHGKACFLDLRDGSGQIQLHAREDLLGEEPYRLLVELDLGDIVGVEGTAMATRRGGELSLAIDRWRLLAKSLRPPPDKFHGLEDVETRLRRRELDLIANEESRRVFRVRAANRVLQASSVTEFLALKAAFVEASPQSGCKAAFEEILSQHLERLSPMVAYSVSAPDPGASKSLVIRIS